MAAYRVKDLFLLPNVLSGARIPLAIAFPLASGNTPLALATLGAAGITDVLDGWAARKLDQATPVGAFLDGLADKIFAGSVLGTLVATGLVTPVAALLLATRELGELPLAVRVLTSKRARLIDVDRRANRLGKVATLLEFTTVVAIIARAPGRSVLLAATAVCGVLAAASYWAREIRADRQHARATAPGRASVLPRRRAADGAPSSQRALGI